MTLANRYQAELRKNEEEKYPACVREPLIERGKQRVGYGRHYRSVIPDPKMGRGR
jgi:hypothetical protein